MNTIVNNLQSVDAVLLLQVRVEPGLDVLHYWLPAMKVINTRLDTLWPSLRTCHRC